MTPKDAYPGTQSIRRALRILRSFTDERREWSLADLADAVGINKTTVYRMLTALEADGMVQRTPDRDGYVLGPELIALGAVALRSSDLRSASQPELRALAEASGETAVLEIASAGEMLILDEVMGPGMVRMQAEVGTRWPLHATSTGKALLAEAERRHGAEAWKRLGLPEVLPRLTPRTVTSRRTLRAELEEVRERGYAIAVEELQAGYAAVGSAVLGREGEPLAALGIGGPTTRVTGARLEELGQLVRERASRVSRRMGAPG